MKVLGLSPSGGTYNFYLYVKVGKFNPIRNEKRYYYCEECKCYHLTSKEKKI